MRIQIRSFHVVLSLGTSNKYVKIKKKSTCGAGSTCRNHPVFSLNMQICPKEKKTSTGRNSLSRFLHLLLIKKRVNPSKDLPHSNIESTGLSYKSVQFTAPLPTILKATSKIKKLQNCLAKTVMSPAVKF